VLRTIDRHGCSIDLRSVEGPEARETFVVCRPADVRGACAERQAEAVYRAIGAALEAEGASHASVVRETLFLRSLRADLAPVRAARQRVLGAGDGVAATEVEQPPLNDGACLEVSVHAIVGATRDSVEAGSSRGLRLRVGEQVQLHAGSLYGSGENAYEQALAMFGVAEDLLQRAGMEFRDVARTWIHLRDIDRDYAALNRARREFFAARGIDPAPASTGIGAGLAPERHDLCLGVYAVGAARAAMTAPTLNEAACYGSDFARGMRVVQNGKVALHVSGTASIDEAGRTAHPGDFDAQVERMLVNVAALLEGQGAGFRDVVSAVTYLKRPADATRLRDKLRAAGFEGFPNALVAAPICRPELLCETELLAVLESA
jgi:enamine deaminase RidA (YjgF/YER057c/UK114 family)